MLPPGRPRPSTILWRSSFHRRLWWHRPALGCRSLQPCMCHTSEPGRVEGGSRRGELTCHDRALIRPPRLHLTRTETMIPWIGYFPSTSSTDLCPVGSASVGNIGVVSRVRQGSGSPAQTISSLSGTDDVPTTRIRRNLRNGTNSYLGG